MFCPLASIDNVAISLVDGLREVGRILREWAVKLCCVDELVTEEVTGSILVGWDTRVDGRAVFRGGPAPSSPERLIDAGIEEIGPTTPILLGDGMV